MESLWQDIRFGLRTLARSPATTAVALVALALGIGANSAIFSVVNGVLLKPLPYPRPQELILLLESNPKLGFPRFSVAPPNFVDWRRQNRVFERLSGLDQTRFNLTGGERPVVVMAERVSADFFPLMGLELKLGRGFRPEEEQPHGAKVTVLANGFWRRYFGADPKVLGRSLTLDGEVYTVIGVTPERFDFPTKRDLYVPLVLDMAQESRGGHHIGVVGRLRRGVSLERARAEMATISSRLERQYPDSNTGWSAQLTPLADIMVEDVRPLLLLLLAAVAVVLLIACANVANLLLARVAARERELAVRVALGAGRGRVVRQMLTESAILFLLGGALGLVLAHWGTRALLALNPEGLPHAERIGLDGRVLLFTFGLALATGLLFGLVPALSATGRRLFEALKEGGRAMAGGARGRVVRNLLVLVEVTVTLVLLIVAGITIRSFARLKTVDPGFRPQGVLALDVAMPASRYPGPQQQSIFVWQLMQLVATLPGVDHAATVYPLPLSGRNFVLAFAVEGQPPPPPGAVPAANVLVVTPDYFHTLGIRLLRGREFSDQDNYRAVPVAIVNRRMAERMWPGGDPLGKRFTFDDPGQPNTRWLTVVGVVADVYHLRLDREPEMEVYWVHYQQPMDAVTLVVHAADGHTHQGLVDAVRGAVSALDPEMPTDQTQTMEQVVSATLQQSRFQAVLLSLFAALGLVLAAVGVYGVVSYSVAQRTHEIGIRMALGARRGEVLRLVVRQGMGLVLAGAALGLVLAWLVMHGWLRSRAFGVSATDPLTFLLVPLALCAVALVANVVPAQRATRVDPLEALRYE
jgi:putative ABC transport system permease protein